MQEVFLCGNLKGRNNFEQLDLRERIILKWILKKTVWGCGLDSHGSG
jgi:hypothetical protein